MLMTGPETGLRELGTAVALEVSFNYMLGVEQDYFGSRTDALESERLRWIMASMLVCYLRTLPLAVKLRLGQTIPKYVAGNPRGEQD